MIKELNVVKKILKNIFDFIKRLFRLDKLNSKEVSGNISEFTKLKLLPYTGISVPFSLGRTIRGVRFSDSLYKDPFAYFCKECTQCESENLLIAYLYKLYIDESCKNAGEVVGFPNNRILKKYPAWALVMPWDSITLQEKYSSYHKDFINNRLENGFNFGKIEPHNLIKSIYSELNARSQFDQTNKLWRSIKLNGILYIKPLPGILIMFDGNQWRWFMSGNGNHRAYLSYIYGGEEFNAEIRGVIKRLNYKSWPNVKNGTYNEAEALQLFDSFFSGDKCCRGVV